MAEVGVSPNQTGHRNWKQDLEWERDRIGAV